MRYMWQHLQRLGTGSAKTRVFATTGVNDLPAGQETTVPPREVELKFQLLPGSEAILRADDIFGPAAQRVHQITTYHDTPDNLLLAAGLTLRIRQETGSFVQTVKSRDDGMAHASSRDEWEWLVANGMPDVNHLAAVPQLARRCP